MLAKMFTDSLLSLSCKRHSQSRRCSLWLRLPIDEPMVKGCVLEYGGPLLVPIEIKVGKAGRQSKPNQIYIKFPSLARRTMYEVPGTGWVEKIVRYLEGRRPILRLFS